jgi:N-methylhydantoinase A
LYDIRYRPAMPLVRRRDVFELPERLDASGRPLVPLDIAEVEQLAARLDGAYDAIAVCLLHSYINAAHERRVVETLRAQLPDAVVVASHEVAPEWREFERTSSTVVSAYVAPLLDEYLTELESRLVEIGLGVPVRVMQSSGGIITAEEARRNPVQTLLSGPVGGTRAGAALWPILAEQQGLRGLVCIDMGGTSFDVSLVVDGDVEIEIQTEIDGHHVLSPAAAIHTIGAGGGSVAHVEAGGLRVGPRSAGALPGPACYGRGGSEPTVTDCNLLLGRLPGSARLAGELALDRDAADDVAATTARALGLSTEQFAVGVVAVADAAMANAIRELTVARGIDPRSFALVAFGGAGPLHAAALAEELDMPAVVIPAYPGVLSAWGMLQADYRLDTSANVFSRLEHVDLDRLRATESSLGDELRRRLKEVEGETESVTTQVAVDARYVGQEYTVTIPADIERDFVGDPPPFRTRFDDAYLARFGHANPDESLEIVNMRLTAVAATPRPADLEVSAEGHAAPATVERTTFATGSSETPVWDRGALPAGMRLDGPAIVLESACTTLVPPGWRADVTSAGHLLMRRGGSDGG